MSMKDSVLCALILGLASQITGCAAIDSGEMVPPNLDRYAQIGPTCCVKVMGLGNGEARDLGCPGQELRNAFEKALVTSLHQSGLFGEVSVYPSEAEYELSVSLREFDDENRFDTRWVLVRRAQDRLVWEDSIATPMPGGMMHIAKRVNLVSRAAIQDALARMTKGGTPGTAHADQK